MLPARDLLREPFTRAELVEAATAVRSVLPPTPTIRWPLLAARSGSEVFVKHENHLPTGAFKVRGGVWLMERLETLAPGTPGVVAATRGNHGQSIAFAAARKGRQAVIVVPYGNNPDKNRAMRAYGAELVEHGTDFDAALAHAGALAAARGLLPLPSFHPLLVQGVSSYALELFADVPDLDAVYAPIGLGSGVAGLVAARDALGLSTTIIGVVSAHADAYAQSFEQGRPVVTASAQTLADGMAVRTPSPAALDYLRRGVARIVRVDDAAVRAAMRHYLDDTHNLAEGAGAAPLAALLGEAQAMRGRRVAVVLSGGNVDRDTLRSVLAG